jgi:hypothetical protein
MVLGSGGSIGAKVLGSGGSIGVKLKYVNI